MDPIADMLAAIKNAYMAKKPNLSVPYSNFKLAILKILQQEKIVSNVTKGDSRIKMDLIYKEGVPELREIKRISKLGRRVYIKTKDIKGVKGGHGFRVISTPKGVMSSRDAKSKKLGGEVICEIW